MKYVSYIFTLIYEYKENKENKPFYILPIMNYLVKSIKFIHQRFEKNIMMFF
jgi:hypothetical protein